MKKPTVFIIAFALILSLTACGDTANSSSDQASEELVSTDLLNQSESSDHKTASSEATATSTDQTTSVKTGSKPGSKPASTSAPKASSAPSKEDPYSVGMADLPLKGFHVVDGALIVETPDQASFFHGEFFSVENAYHYQNGRLLQLKPFEIEVNISTDVSKRGELSFLMKYFVCQDTVYPYFSFHPIHQRILGIEIASLLGNSQNILIYGAGIEPIVYNVVSGEYRRLFTETESCAVAFAAGIDADGKYVALIGGSTEEISDGKGTHYVLNLKSGKSQKLLVPEYDKSKYTGHSVTPQRFVGDELLVTYRINCASNNDENYSETYYYNLKNGEMRQWNKEFEGDMSCSTNDYFFVKTDRNKGSIRVCNIKTEEDFYFEIGPHFDIQGSLNESGRYLIGEYKQLIVSHYDDRGNAVYEDTSTPYIPAFIDLEKGEIIEEIAEHIKGFSITEYKDRAVTSKQWMDETHLLITYEKENGYYTDILDLKNAMK